MKIAHLSDPHLLDTTGVSPWQLYGNKRFTGMVNLRLKREHKHKPHVVEAMVEDIRAQGVDHVVVTGDLTNLALEPEFVRARKTLDALGMRAADVTVIPGNHDRYTRGSAAGLRFERHFAEHIACDLDLPRDGAFPFVRLRGPVAFIGLSTAVPRLPLVSSGRLGAAQLDVLARCLDHPEVRARTPVGLTHHPLVNPDARVRRTLRGLSDADLLRGALAHLPRVLALHGHLHHRGQETLSTRGGALHLLGATSASMLHHDPTRMAGYNLYSLGPDGGLAGVTARVWDAATARFVDGDVGPSEARRG